jgi:hypothetical protein
MRKKPIVRNDEYENATKIRVVKDRFDVRNLHLPTVTIVSIVIFCMWLTWSASSERNNIQTQLTEISLKVTQLTEKEVKIDELSVLSAKRLDALENRTLDDEKDILTNHKMLKDGSNWTRSDHLIWCLESQIKNPTWKCIDNNELEKLENVIQSPNKDEDKPKK